MKVREGFIQIFVEPKTGNFIYVPSVYHAAPNSSITWIANGNWAAQFPHGTPLAEGQISLGGSRGVEIPSTVSKAKGVYHYMVAVEIEGRVFLDAGCPTIIIN